MVVYQYLNIALICLAVVGCTLLVGLLTVRVTGNQYASLVAGFSLFLLPGFAIRPAYGFKAKYLLLFFGLLSIYLVLTDRPLASGAAAAASVSFYQLGIIFPVVVFALALERSGRTDAVRVAAGGVALTVVSLAPVVLLWDAGSQMVAQAFVIPLIVGGEASVLTKVLAAGAHFKWAAPLVVVGAVGFLRHLRSELTGSHWWITACTLWFAFALLFIDFDTGGYTDLIPGLAFLAIAIGLFADSLSTPDHRVALSVALAAVLVVNVVALGSFGLVFSPADTVEPQSMADLRTNERAAGLATVPDGTPDVRYLYWNKKTAATCHYRLSLAEVHWLERVGGGLSADCSDIAEVRRTTGW
jgi:hypothetical protein